VASQLGVRAFPTLEALVAASDAVSVATATRAHHATAKAVVTAGRHVFVEKPITATVAEADDLLAAAAAAGVVVQVGHVERFNRAVRAARPHLRGVRYVEVERLAPYTPRGADVSVVADLMIHDVDLVLGIIGEVPVRVDAMGASVLRPTADLAQARLTFPSGAVANLSASRLSRERRRRLRAYQPGSYVSLDLAAGTGELLRLRDGLDAAALAQAPQDTAAFTERVALEAPEGEPLKLEFEAWLAAVRGEAPPPVSGQAGRDALAVAQAIEAALDAAVHSAPEASGGAPIESARVAAGAAPDGPAGAARGA
jgi:predicted dehydrogenase